MPTILDNAISGLNSASSRIANATASIVNATSTQKNSAQPSSDLATDLVTISGAKVDYAASAKVLSVQKKLDDALLDIQV